MKQKVIAYVCALPVAPKKFLMCWERAVEDAGFCNVCHTSMVSNGKAGGSVQDHEN